MSTLSKEEVLRLECMKIVWATASRVGVEEDARVKAAEKVYKYVTGDKEKSPSDTTS